MNVAELSKIIERPLMSELVLGTELAVCDQSGCKTPTLWRRKGQYKHGFCVNHALADGPDLGGALKNALTAFPDVEWVGDCDPPEIFPPGEYGRRVQRLLMRGRWARVRPYWFIDARYQPSPPYWVGAIVSPPIDAGPCQGCWQLVRTYGPDAYPFCSTCEERKR